MAKSYPTKNNVQKETITRVIDVKDATGATVDVSGATITLWCKRDLNDKVDYLFQKADVDFTKNVGGQNYTVSVVLDSTDTDWNGYAFVIIYFDIGAGSKLKGIYRQFLEISPEIGP